MRIRKDGRLVVDFKTTADFRGLFVPQYTGMLFFSIQIKKNPLNKLII